MHASDDIESIKFKYFKLEKRFNCEREERIKGDDKIKLLLRNIAILTDHMERLMQALSRESTARIRCLEEMRTLKANIKSKNEKISKLQRKCTASQRMFAEVREGSKILEDQVTFYLY